MSGRLCNKCRAWIPLAGDTWCIGCTASEELRGEFLKAWNAPYRRIAHDLVISVTRQIKALRTLSLGVQSQIQSEASRRASSAAGKVPVPERREAKSESADERGALPRRRSTAPKSRPRVEEKGAPEESDSYETEPTDQEEEGESQKDPPPDHHHRPLGGGDQRPPEPDKGPEGGAQDQRKKAEPRERSARRQTASRPAKEQQSRGRRHRPHHRAGRKHQRLYRLLENPSLRVHQRPAANLWELEETFQCNRGLH